MAIGTLTTRTMKARKTGRVFTYQVYQSAKGGVFVARLMTTAGAESVGEWSGPMLTEEEAIRDAARIEIAKTKAARERNAEYARSGGY